MLELDSYFGAKTVIPKMWSITGSKIQKYILMNEGQSAGGGYKESAFKEGPQIILCTL